MEASRDIIMEYNIKNEQRMTCGFASHALYCYVLFLNIT